ncbi:MAG: Na+/H+ antiporter NhaA [Pseudomarimonas sp.]
MHRPPAQRARDSLQRFLELESAGGILLVIAALLAILLANSPLVDVYHGFLDLPMTVTVGTLGVDKPLLLWINDGFMAVFFLLVALELKREVVSGHFSDRRQIALPVFCAAGGVIVPAAIYYGINQGDPVAMSGWAIPAATDIAFALGVLSLLGSRVPTSLKLLLTAIAVLDDLAAIVIIALYYSGQLSSASLLIAGGMFAILIAMNRRGVTQLMPYLVVGAIMWLAVLKSGVHATLAGVALGMTIPMGNRNDPGVTPLETLEHALHPWVAYAILPLFAFANAGLPLAGLGLGALLAPVPLGIAAGLVIGKPVGIVLAALMVIGLGFAKLPDGANRLQFVGLTFLCGIGFTMSLFIGSLAFEHSGEDLAALYRLGILSGSLIAAVLGTLLLLLAARLPKPAT